MDVEQRQTADDPHIKPTELAVSPPVGCYRLHPPSPFIITQPESDTHFTVTRRVEGWVNLGTKDVRNFKLA